MSMAAGPPGEIESGHGIPVVLPHRPANRLSRRAAGAVEELRAAGQCRRCGAEEPAGRGQLVRAARRHDAGTRWGEQRRPIPGGDGQPGRLYLRRGRPAPSHCPCPRRRDGGRDESYRTVEQSLRPAGGAARHRIVAHFARWLRGADRAASARHDEPDADAGAPIEGRDTRHGQGAASDLCHRAAAGWSRRSAHRPPVGARLGRYRHSRRGAGRTGVRTVGGMVQHLRGRARHRLLSRRRARQSLDTSVPAPGRPHLPAGARQPALAAGAAGHAGLQGARVGLAAASAAASRWRQRGAARAFHHPQRIVLQPSSPACRPCRRRGAGGALHRRPRRGAGAGGRRRAGLRPYRHHQGAEGSGRAVR